MRIIQPLRRSANSKAEFSKSETKEPKPNSELGSNSLTPKNRDECSSGKHEYQANESLDHTTRERATVAAELAPGRKRRRSALGHTFTHANGQTAGEPLELVVDPAKKEFNELFARGVRLLAMREHSVKEITSKLFDKSDRSDLVPAVVEDLLEKKYLSDERFTESYVRARGNRGFGPVKIRTELKSKGISSVLIQEHLNESAAHWFDSAAAQYQKKYGDAPVSDYNSWTKRARFMQSRGFTMEHIHVTLPSVEFD